MKIMQNIIWLSVILSPATAFAHFGHGSPEGFWYQLMHTLPGMEYPLITLSIALWLLLLLSYKLYLWLKEASVASAQRQKQKLQVKKT
ncbi:hypothetical protein [Candidatus Venteria ishoeyi]|uniref:Uncharacterized protein n=1 Tax=Candidatus Venteria ishoeyi TaxID=1899563 RepID=A0A1H6FHN7_9GAMM|nr:hypothetical protein [Candidatus Venteria ishoeyi]SEH08889.1 Uncharacterised protein [Candidatus Venteria ishoeyi]